jgi:hypothetical protein
MNLSRGKILLLGCLFLLTGCASLPDFGRLQGNMDQMLYYMGVMSSGMPTMVHSTRRMADTAERMERKSDRMLTDLTSRGKGAERAVQNYAQAFVDNDRAMIKSLRGIRSELSELKQSLPRSEGPVSRSGQADQAEVNRKLQAKLNDLEARFQALSSKMSKLEQQSK